MDESAPILLFDSGVGGLSVLAELRKALPDAPVVYAADNGGLPYGTKTEAEVAARVCGLLGRMAERFRPRLICIACNTASTIALGMVRDVLNAYAARDAELAVEVIHRDEKLDNFYDSLFRNLVAHMMENPATISSAAQLLFVARNLERVGDHATNVAEMVYFAATGLYHSERELPGGDEKVI